MRRAANSSLAGEANSLCQSLGEADWIQLLLRDACFGDVPTADWRQHAGPYVSVLRDNCELHRPLPGVHAADAKSIFDCLSKNCAGRKEDRRTSVDLAIARDSFSQRGSCVKWFPHLLNPTDVMTKADVSKGSDAMGHMIRRGTLTLSDAESERAHLLAGGEKGRRSREASRRYLQDRERRLEESGRQ